MALGAAATQVHKKRIASGKARSADDSPDSLTVCVLSFDTQHIVFVRPLSPDQNMAQNGVETVERQTKK